MELNAFNIDKAIATPIITAMIDKITLNTWLELIAVNIPITIKPPNAKIKGVGIFIENIKNTINATTTKPNKAIDPKPNAPPSKKIDSKLLVAKNVITINHTLIIPVACKM